MRKRQLRKALALLLSLTIILSSTTAAWAVDSAGKFLEVGEDSVVPDDDTERLNNINDEVEPGLAEEDGEPLLDAMSQLVAGTTESDLESQVETAQASLSARHIVADAGELEQAIAGAAEGDVIELANGFDLPETLEIDKSLTIRAAQGEVVLTTSNGYRHFLVTGGEVTLVFEEVVLDGGGEAGGIRTDAEHLILDAVIQNCVASDQDPLTLSGADAGGGVYVDGIITINGGSIINNSAYLGGGIYASANATINLINGDIALNNGENGGGIFGYTDSAINIQGGEISDNMAFAGGGVNSSSASNGQSTITITGGKILNNTASYTGGGLSLNRCILTIADGEILNNVSNDYGGGVYLKNYSTIIMEGGKISGNSCRNSGGGIHLSSTSANAACAAIVKGGEISNNTANNDKGGGIYSNANSSIHIIDGNIFGNQALNGGGVYGYAVDIEGGVLSGNTARSYGGGVYGYVWSTWDVFVNVAGGQIVNNKAGSDGGGSMLPI